MELEAIITGSEEVETACDISDNECVGSVIRPCYISKFSTYSKEDSLLNIYLSNYPLCKKV